MFDSSPTTIIEVVRNRARLQPDRTAYTYLTQTEADGERVSYRDLNEDAKRVAFELARRSRPGDRVLLVIPSALEFVVGFLGCMYAGTIAVPVNPPNSGRRIDRLASILADSGATVALTTTRLLTPSVGSSRKIVAGHEIEWLDLAELRHTSDAALSEDQLALPGEAPAYLQYTSGSTGTPKGVVVSHANLMYNLNDLALTLAVTTESVMITWLPLFHDMGLVFGALLPLFGGFPCYLMNPSHFLQSPERWLRAITRWRATHCGAPNFAFELCAREVDEEKRAGLDLSSLIALACGAEPIRKSTLLDFAAAFKDCGFRLESFCPGYGLAEATLKVTAVTHREAPSFCNVSKAALERGKIVETAAEDSDAQALVDLGTCDSATEVAIVDPVREILCAAGDVGEIWVSGPGVAQGYWNRPTETERTFGARLADSEQGTFLRTGDLGFVRDGRLFVTGRLKDLIIIRGNNHYPQDIEWTVQQSHPALEADAGAAFSVECETGEELVVVQELKRSAFRKVDADEVTQAIRHAIASEHGLQTHAILLLKPGGIPKTSSGKVRRSDCRQGFLEGTLEPVSQVIIPAIGKPRGIGSRRSAPSRRDHAALQSWLLDRAAIHLKTGDGELDPTEPLSRYGLDSMTAVELAGDLAAALGREVPPTVFYDYPTIRQLAAYLADADRLPQAVMDRTSSAVAGDPIAVVGFSGRFPGAADIDEFRELLFNGVDAIREVPHERDEFRGAASTPEGFPVARGGFIEAIDQFDPGFFGISPREAVHMDPQQRLLLEVSWTAIEHAGISADTLAGRNIGVFIGVSSMDYLHLLEGSPERFNSYAGTGNALSIAANRVSYLLDLRGPSLVIDTACSSSLVAVHQACEALRRGEVEAALAGGVNLILSPDTTRVFGRAGMLSADGRCKTFDSAADGYVRGEGCGMVLLKPLKKALADGDTVHAVILGSAVNQDGKSNGLTAPNGPSQEAVIRRALAAGGVTPQDIGYVETHGTGTGLGDPIEVRALKSVYGSLGTPATPCYLGAVKTNIGHLESAAGIAGLIKTILVLKLAEIPPNLHFHTLNREIDLTDSRLRLPLQVTRWEAANGRRRAGVSSFGFGGTNAHVVLEEPPLLDKAVASAPAWRHHLLTVSARSREALRQLGESYETRLAALNGGTVDSVCYTSNVCRKHFEYRLAALGTTADELMERLAAFRGSTVSADLYVGDLDRHDPPIIAFLFTGQGAQRKGMGRELFETQQVFRETFHRCDAIAQSLAEKSLAEILYDSEDSVSVDDTANSQPLLFALEYSLAKMWESWGIRPAAVMGHSVGEYAAACIAGVFSLEDGVRLTLERGRLMQSLPRLGAVFAVSASEAEVRSAIQPYEHAVSIAAVNGPLQTVVSGEADALERVIDSFREKEVAVRKLDVSHAVHSPLMRPMLGDFEQVARSVSYRKPEITLISNVTGLEATEEVTDPAYWTRHVLAPVRFYEGMQALSSRGCGVYIEVGPGPVLLSLGRQCLPDGRALWLPSLRAGRSDWEQLLENLATVYVRGGPIDWEGVHLGHRPPKAELPAYRFQRERCWINSRRDLDPSETPAAAQAGCTQVPSASEREAIFNWRVASHTPAYLGEHRVRGNLLAPAALFLDMVLEAGVRTIENRGMLLEGFAVESPLLLAERESKLLQLLIKKDSGPRHTFQLFSLDGETDASRALWIRHASGTLAAQEDLQQTADTIERLRERCINTVDVGGLYSRYAKCGVEYGPSLRVIRRLWRSGDEALGRIEAPADAALAIVIDAAFQTAGCLLPEQFTDIAYLPVGISAFHAREPIPREFWCHVRLTSADEVQVRAEVRLLDDTGGLIAGIDGFTCQRSRTVAEKDLRPWLHKVEWRPQSIEAGNGGTASLPAPAKIKERIQERWVDSAMATALEAHINAEAAMEKLAGLYAMEAIRGLHGPLVPGHRFTVQALAERSGVLPRYHQLLERLLKILEEDRAVVCESDTWRVLIALDNSQPVDSGSLLMDLRERYPAASVELKLLERCGEQLAAVLTGEREPLELLFPQGDTSFLFDLYHHSPGARVMNQAIETAATALVESPSRNRRLRVLEVGGGTGGTTAQLIPALKMDMVEYTFTDVSPLLLTKARQRFSTCASFVCRPFDVERSPEEQGFRESEYDLVIASNVLHATADLRRSLNHIRKVLSSNGTLVLVEGTRRLRFLDLTFGLTEGWWRYADRDLRPDHPLISADQWSELLEETGFAPVETLTPRSKAQGNSTAAFSVLVARRPDVPEIAAQANQKGHWILFAEPDDTVTALSKRLHDAGYSSTLVTPGGNYDWLSPERCTLVPTCKEHFDQLRTDIVSRNGRPVVGVLYLSSVSSDRVSEIELSCSSLLHLVQTFCRTSAKPAPRLFVVTIGAQAGPERDSVDGLFSSPLWGMGKGISIELPELRCVRIDLDSVRSPNEAGWIFEELSSPFAESEVIYRKGVRYVSRLVVLPEEQKLVTPVAETYDLAAERPGDLTSLRFNAGSRRAPGLNEVEIRVDVTGLNFRDLLVALGRTSLSSSPERLGGECAGQIVRVGDGVTTLRAGDDVLALADGALSRYVTVCADSVVRRPPSLRIEDAVAIPSNFLTAHYALKMAADLRDGDTVLVHAAAGGTGLAAIQIARQLGVSIIGTASPWKWNYLKLQGVSHTFDSRSLLFADQTLQATRGQGVRAVINSFAGDFIAKGFSVLKSGGTFVEIGKSEVLSEQQARRFREDVDYRFFDLVSTVQKDPAGVRSTLQTLVTQFESGILKQPPCQVFSIEHVAEAFRYMQQARHIGKIVVDHRRSAGRVQLDSGGTYLITGGLGALGQRVTRWMATRKAGRIVLLGRKPPDEETRLAIEAMQATGTDVSFVLCDVTDRQKLSQVFEDIDRSPYKLRGVVHLAGVLEDGMLLEQDMNRFSRVLHPKVLGAWNLHELTQNRYLDSFVLFSSAAGVLGSPGQANHSAANAFLDALAHHRRSLGLPALCIQWGVWSEIGAAVERRSHLRTKTYGMEGISTEDGIQLLEKLWDSRQENVCVIKVDWQLFKTSMAGLALERFLDSVGQSTIHRNEPEKAILRQLESARPDDRRRVLIEFIRLEVARILGLSSPHLVADRRGFFEIGMDSLSSMELRSLMQQQFNCILPTTLTFDFPTVEQLADYLIKESIPIDFGNAGREAVEHETNHLLDDLSDQQVEDELKKELDTIL